MVVSVRGQRPRRSSTGIPHDAPTAAQRAELKQKAEAIYVDAQAHAVLERAGVGPKPTRSLKDHLDWYEKHVTVHKRGAGRERELLAELRKAFGAATLQELTRERIVEWRTERRRQVSAATVNRETDVLKHALAQAVPSYLAESPIAKLKRLVAPPGAETGVLSRADEAKLLKRLPPRDQALVIVAIDTLIRAGDLLELMWNDIHVDYVTVRWPKTGQSYRTPLSTRARAALKALPRRGLYVFAHRRHAKTERVRTNGLKNMLEDACKAAGVVYGRGRGITFHALRHTGATRLAEAGVDLRTIQEIGGWKSLRMLTRYVHPTDARKAEAVEAIGRGVEFTPPSRAKGAKKSAHSAA